MVAYIVKHIVKNRGYIREILYRIRRNPYCYTSKTSQAFGAANGNDVYILETESVSRITVYRLAYRFRAYQCLEKHDKWEGRFRYKVVCGEDREPEGVYFEIPVLINDPDLLNWCRDQRFGMVEIPELFVDVLEQMVSDPRNHAQPLD